MEIESGRLAEYSSGIQLLWVNKTAGESRLSCQTFLNLKLFIWSIY